MSNLVSRTRTVHAAAVSPSNVNWVIGGNVPLCGARVATLNGNTGHLSVTCGNCRRMITRAHAEALELHQAFLLGVAQAEVPAVLLGRPVGLNALSDSLLSDELLYARSELRQADRLEWMAGCARRLTMLKLERDFRAAEMADAVSVGGGVYRPSLVVSKLSHVVDN